MERGETLGHIVLTEQEKIVAAEALYARGYLETADALNNTARREIPPLPVGLIMDSVRHLAKNGGRPDADTMLEAYFQTII